MAHRSSQGYSRFGEHCCPGIKGGIVIKVAPDFAPALDVPHGGVQCALPALLAVGLLDGVERFLSLPKGYYGLDSLLLLLAFMALARLRSIESRRWCSTTKAIPRRSSCG
jgi:hypothetical protein